MPHVGRGQESRRATGKDCSYVHVQETCCGTAGSLLSTEVWLQSPILWGHEGQPGTATQPNLPHKDVVRLTEEPALLQRLKHH